MYDNLVVARVSPESLAYDGTLVCRQVIESDLIKRGAHYYDYPYFVKPITVPTHHLDKNWLIGLPTYTQDDGYLRKVIDLIHYYKGKAIGMVYDFDFLRGLSSDSFKEISQYNKFDIIMVPSELMRTYLMNHGLVVECIVNGPYGYTSNYSLVSKPTKGILYSGNLSDTKSSFLDKVTINLSLLGPEYTDRSKSNLHYHGAVKPLVLPSIAREYLAGLIWDSGDTDQPSYRYYLRYNWPAKLSGYLASGIPVIAPSDSNAGHFIETNHLGVTIDNLSDLNEVNSNLLLELRPHVQEFSQLIRNNYYINWTLENELSD